VADVEDVGVAGDRNAADLALIGHRPQVLVHLAGPAAIEHHLVRVRLEDDRMAPHEVLIESSENRR
jgi:hypothetical protein